MVEQKVVHLPEGALLGRRLGGLRGELGVRMDVVQRQVPPDVADVAEVAQELAHDRLGLPAVRALEVAVLDDRDGRVERPADVVALGSTSMIEVDERLDGAEQRAHAEPSREQRGRAEEQPGEERRAEGGAQDAELRLLELAARRRRASRSAATTVKPIAGDRAAACDGRPADRRPQPAAAQPRHQPRAAEDPERLADDVAEQDPERDRRAERTRRGSRRRSRCPAFASANSGTIT